MIFHNILKTIIHWNIVYFASIILQWNDFKSSLSYTIRKRFENKINDSRVFSNNNNNLILMMHAFYRSTLPYI